MSHPQILSTTIPSTHNCPFPPQSSSDWPTPNRTVWCRIIKTYSSVNLCIKGTRILQQRQLRPAIDACGLYFVNKLRRRNLDHQTYSLHCAHTLQSCATFRTDTREVDGLPMSQSPLLIRISATIPKIHDNIRYTHCISAYPLFYLCIFRCWHSEGLSLRQR
jgi:hypothetical protein